MVIAYLSDLNLSFFPPPIDCCKMICRIRRKMASGNKFRGNAF